MKTQHRFLAINLFALCLLFTGCEVYTHDQIVLTLVTDTTGSFDTNTLDITASDILDLFDFDNTPLNYGMVRTMHLSDVSYDQIEQIRIPFVSDNEYQRYVREADIRQFGQQVDSVLTRLAYASHGKEASNLFTPLVRELKRLETSQANTKILVIYSDLFHNDHEYSVYRRVPNVSVFEQELTEFMTQKINPLGDLHGIDVYVIYQPTLKTDQKFTLVSRVFTKILQEKGARVSVGSNFIKL